eukprot:25062_1
MTTSPDFNETSDVYTTTRSIVNPSLYFTTATIHDTNVLTRNPWIVYCIYGGALLLIICGLCVCFIVYCVARNNDKHGVSSMTRKGQDAHEHKDELTTSLLTSNDSQNNAAVDIKMDFKPNVETLNTKNVELTNIRQNASKSDKLATILRTSNPPIVEPDNQYVVSEHSKDNAYGSEIISSGSDAQLGNKPTKKVNNAKSKRKKKTRKKLVL